MTDIVSRHGRDFEFDPDVSAEQRDKRILNWMQKNAPDELKEKTTPVSQTSSPAAPEVEREPNKSPNKSGDSAALRMLSTVLMGPTGPLWNMVPGVNKAMGDVNSYRTAAQGMVPFADEITAGVRSLGGTPYDKALAEERQGVKDFGETYGEGAKTGLELAGAASTIPLGMGIASTIAKGVPGGARLAQLVAQHPWLAGAGVGAVSGAASGFGAGEGGLENRLENAGTSAALGTAVGPLAYAATKGVEKIGGFLNTDNRVANFLRKRIAGEKKLDMDSPTFVQDADQRLTRDMAEQLHYRTDPRAADILPETTEAVLQKPGKGPTELAESLLDRQYNRELAKTNEAAARSEGQYGRVGKAFDTAFGHDMFQHTDDDLLRQRRDNARALYDPAYRQNVRTAEIDDALDRLNTLSPNIAQTAQRWAAAERRPIGTFHPDGSINEYNTQYLHDIKRSMDEVLGEQGRMNPRFNQVPYNNAKRDLNEAVMTANPEYRTAMTQYGDDSGLIEALRRGREDVFVPGSVDKTGAMDERAIRDYLADTNVPQAHKDLFMSGAARALRENVLASQSRKYTHNWADIVNNPDYEKKIGALVNGRQLGGWDLFRGQLKKESENFKNATRAMGNSRTNVRQELMKEMEGIPDAALAAAGLGINPKAPGGWRGVGTLLKNKLDRTEAMVNKTGSLLAKSGPAGNRESLDEISRLLTEQEARTARYKRRAAYAPVVGGSLSYSSESRRD